MSIVVSKSMTIDHDDNWTNTANSNQTTSRWGESKKLGKHFSIVSGTRRYCSVSSCRRYWTPMILYHQLIALLQASVAPPYNHYKPSKYFIRLSCIRTKLSRHYHYISVWWLTAVLFRGLKSSPEKWQRLTVTGRWACFFVLVQINRVQEWIYLQGH